MILLTNDDGIYSKGIYSLQKTLSEVGDTIVVAPDGEKSGVGHGITISDPIRVNDFGNKDGFSGYAVSGTPADCIKIAFNTLLERKPDIVVSGINRGANIGLSVLYSGTVSAAAESVIQGVPAIDIYLDDWLSPDYSYSYKVAKKIENAQLFNNFVTILPCYSRHFALFQVLYYFVTTTTLPL